MSKVDIAFHQISPFNQYQLTKAIWTDIEKRATPSFYLSWHWMESWLKTLEGNENLSFVYGSYDCTPIFCYFLGYRASFKHKIIYSKRAYLNQTGDPSKDCIIVEHNGILLDKNFLNVNDLNIFESSSRWNELIANFVNPEQSKHFKNCKKGLNLRLEENDKAFQIDLENVRGSDNDLLPILSKNKRSQIRRSIKAYEKEGPISLKVSKSLPEALSDFDVLKKLHQKVWKAKGKDGAFSSKFKNEFHNNLIEINFEQGGVEIISVLCGNNVIGTLYNFIHNKTICFYQSGFENRKENIFKPGLVTHYLAINHYAKLGYDIYDLLVGEMDYKKSLGSKAYFMPCYRLRKNLFRFYLEDKLRDLKNKLKH